MTSLFLARATLTVESKWINLLKVGTFVLVTLGCRASGTGIKETRKCIDEPSTQPYKRNGWKPFRYELPHAEMSCTQNVMLLVNNECRAIQKLFCIHLLRMYAGNETFVTKSLILSTLHPHYMNTKHSLDVLHSLPIK